MPNTLQMSIILTAATSGMQSAFGNTNNRIRRLNESINQTERYLRNVQRVQNEVARNGSRNSEAWNRIGNNRINQLQAQLNSQRFDRNMIQNRQSVAAFTDTAQNNLTGSIGTLTGLAAVVKPAMDFQAAMADVSKFVDVDAKGLKVMGNEILKMSTRLPISADALAKIVAFGGQAQIEKENLMAFAETAAKMGVAFDVPAEKAGEMMANWRTAFKMGQGDVTILADKVNMLGNTTAASASKISEVVTRVGALGEVAGVNAGQVAALGASMIGVGVQEEIAATGVKNFMLTLVAGESATRTQAEAFQSLGMDATELAKRMQTDTKGAILDVLKAVKKLPPEIRAAKLQDLFGKESLGAIAPLLTSLESVEKNLNAVGDASAYAGSMDVEFAKKAATSAARWEEFKNKLNSLAITIGETLLPALNQLMDKFGSLFNKITEFSAAHPELVSNITNLVAAFMGFAAVGNVLAFVGVDILPQLKHWDSWIQTIVAGEPRLKPSLQTELMPQL